MSRLLWRGLHVLRYVTAVGLGLLTLWYGWWTFYEFSHATDIDPTDRCAPAESGHCFTDRSGTVTGAGSWYDIRVQYDDGRRSMGLFMESHSPAPGTRVRIESWDGGVVSVYDPGRKRRFLTNEWPQRWDWGWIAAGTLTLVLSLLAWPGLVGRVRRLVTRRADEAPP